MRTAVIALVLAACGGSNKSATMAKSDGPTCAAVADSMVAMMAEGKESTKAFVDAKEGFVTIIRTRCTDDVWTAEAKQCLATMKSRADAERCSTLLTETQQANLVRDQKAKFGADPEPEAQAAEPAAAPPAPLEAEKNEPPKKLRSAPAKPAKTKKAGDPCDGGE
jgi:hypothetical protein